MKLSSVHYSGLSIILHENLKDEFGLVIGRADKRYTLWKYNKEHTPAGSVIHVAYVQILSDKRSRVEARFPGIYICEELRGEHRMAFGKGRSSICKTPKAPKTIDDFLSLPFGEFRGIPFKEVTNAFYWCKLANNGCVWTDAYGVEFDFRSIVEERCSELGCRNIAGEWFTEDYFNSESRVCWRATNAENLEQRAAFAEIAKSMGCICLMGRWYAGIPMDNEKPWMTTARQILPHIEKGEQFSFVPHYNGNGFWFGLPVEFLPEDKEDVYTYYGSSHFLKVTNKKGVKVNKRVKGKTIEVLEYEVLEDNENKPYILVKKFDVK